MSKLLALTLDIAGEAQNQQLQGAQYHNSSDGGFGILFSGIIGVAMVIAVILVFVYLIWGSIEWITSSGDKGKTEGARNKISNAIVGILILAASIAVFTLLEKFLGIDVLTFR